MLGGNRDGVVVDDGGVKGASSTAVYVSQTFEKKRKELLWYVISS